MYIFFLQSYVMTFEEAIKGLEKDEMFDVTFRLQQKFTRWGKKKTHFRNKTASELKTNNHTKYHQKRAAKLNTYFPISSLKL